MELPRDDKKWSIIPHFCTPLYPPKGGESCNDRNSLQHFLKTFLTVLTTTTTTFMSGWHWDCLLRNFHFFIFPFILCIKIASQKHQERELHYLGLSSLPPSHFHFHCFAWDSSYIYFALLPFHVTSDCYSELSSSKIVSCTAFTLYCQHKNIILILSEI